MKIVCDACQAKYSIADEKIQGKNFKIRCKKCSHVIVVRVEPAPSAFPEDDEDKQDTEVISPKTEVASPQTDWYVVVDGETVGPLAADVLQGLVNLGAIHSYTLVWTEGLADWVGLSSVPEFASAAWKSKNKQSSPLESNTSRIRQLLQRLTRNGVERGTSGPWHTQDSGHRSQPAPDVLPTTGADQGKGPPRRPKYQMFISSTFEDLRDERKAVTWVLLKDGHIPAGMENFSAAPDRGWRVISRTIDLSDYYVLLVGGRYGSIDTDTGLSWTELEYNYAIKKKITVLAFVREESAISLAKAEKKAEEREKLRGFIAKLRQTHLCEMWSTTEDLLLKVSQALGKQIRDDEEAGRAPPGWYRGKDPAPLSPIDDDV